MTQDTPAIPHPKRPTASANPFRCFQGAFLRDAFLIGLAIVALGYFGRRFPVGTGVRLTVATIQALLLGAIVVRTVLSIRRLDELLLKVHLESIAISFTIFASLISGWAMLEKAGAPSIEWGVWAWPIMALLWCVAVVIRGRQYR
jgi:hypothetical protein